MPRQDQRRDDGPPPVALERVNQSQYGVGQVVRRNVPDWTRSEHQLFRGDGRSPDQIRADGGFRPPYMSQADWRNDPQRAVADIAKHVGGGTNAFVSTSTDRRVGEHFAISQYNYVINAPGGIYTDPTLRQKTGKESHGEREVLFPGGIDWRYVKGWHKMSWDVGAGDWVAGDFVPNPDYIGDRIAPQQHAKSDPSSRYGPSTQDATRTGGPTDRGTSPATEQRSAPGSLGDRMGRLDDPRLDALRPHLQSTEGGMSAFAPPQHASGKWAHDNEMYTARQVPKIPGQFVVDMHGSPTGVRIGDTPLSEKDVADLIRANPDYDGGPVTLFGCKTGDGFAARVAQELGAPVTAPNADAWVDHDGNVFASGQAFNNDIGKPPKPVWPPNGEWSTHSPDGERTVHNGPYPPGHTPAWGDNTPSRPVGVAAHRGDDPQPPADDGSPDDDNTASAVPQPHSGPVRYPTQQPMGDAYTYETDPQHPRNPFRPKAVTRLTPQQLEEHRVFVDPEGLMRSARDGALFDTHTGTSNWGGQRAIFVMDARGNIYASNNHAVGHFHHSSLGGGGPVAAAGELSVTNGVVNYATAASGHYRPEPEHMANLDHEFTRCGIRPPIWDFRGPRPGGRPLFDQEETQ